MTHIRSVPRSECDHLTDSTEIVSTTDLYVVVKRTCALCDAFQVAYVKFGAWIREES